MGMALGNTSRAGGMMCYLLAAGAALGQAYDANLIVNPGFEDGPSSANGQTVVSPPGWTAVGSATVVPYGAGPDFPDVGSPGPGNRGGQFLAGGPNNSFSQCFQTLDLNTYGTSIDAGGVLFRFSGWLGGFGTQDDIARAIIVWADGAGTSVRTDTLVGPSAAVRQGVTGLSVYWTQSLVPAGTRQALVTITLARVIGPYNNAYADNISLELTRVCDSIDFNNDQSSFDPLDIEAFLSIYSEGDCIPAGADCNDIDFNNDGAAFDPLDIESFLSVFSEGPCVPV
jgi:hypothetical protein